MKKNMIRTFALLAIGFAATIGTASAQSTTKNSKGTVQEKTQPAEKSNKLKVGGESQGTPASTTSTPKATSNTAPAQGNNAAPDAQAAPAPAARKAAPQKSTAPVGTSRSKKAATAAPARK